MARWSSGIFFVLIVCFTVGLALGRAQSQSDSSPDVTGEWAGTWGIYLPEHKKEAEAGKRGLDCEVVRKADGGWHATFHGDCGRPYRYTIQMEGRQAGDSVMFKGTTDLGEEDGGVYDWIGRADGEQFVGFYTSSKYVGVFHLSRKK